MQEQSQENPTQCSTALPATSSLALGPSGRQGCVPTPASSSAPRLGQIHRAKAEVSVMWPLAAGALLGVVGSFHVSYQAGIE